MSAERRTFGHKANDLSGETVLSVSVPNMPPNGVIRWNIPSGASRSKIAVIRADGSVGTSETGTTVRLRGFESGVAEIHCAVFDSAGKRLESERYVVSVPRFVWIGEDTAQTHLSASLNRSNTQITNIMSSARDALAIRYVDVNVRFVWQNSAESLPVHLRASNDPVFPGSVRPIGDVVIARIVGDPAAVNPATGAPWAPGHLGQSFFPVGVIPGDPTTFQSGTSLDAFEIAQTHLTAYLNTPGGASTSDILDAVDDGFRNATLGAIEESEAMIFYGRLIGSVLAHELGHVLLRTPHLAAGVGQLMQAADDQSIEEFAGSQLLPGGGSNGGAGFAMLPDKDMVMFAPATIASLTDRNHYPAAPPLLESQL